jgi:TonB-linked SusC/RagA family outer membrane protein
MLMIKRKLILFLAFLCVSIPLSFSQTTKVTGLVIDAAGEPIIGSVVYPKGNTKIGTITDFNGKFEINVPVQTKFLVFSYLGYKMQELPLKPNMKVVMETDSKQLDEVVVTGMQKMDKRLFTGATTKLDADKTRMDGVPDVSRALEGRVAGVSVQNVSGTFGTAPKIRVRGATSIYGNSKPLWVVDGVVMEDAVDVSVDQLSSGDAVTLVSSAVAGLNADDIESFQILKDGSATSIYGARAMSGVIVITTKKGQAGVSRINYTGELSMRMKPSYNNFNISNSQEQMGIYKEMEGKGWLEFASIANGANSGIYGKMYNLIDQYNSSNGTYGLAFTQSAMNGYLQEAEFRNTDWFDLLFRNTITQNHAVSISSGTEKARFYASISAMNDPGWTQASSVKRYTANANATFNLSKKLSLGILTNASYRNQEAPGTLGQGTDVVRGEVKRDFDINPYSYAMNTSRTLDPTEYYKRNYAAFNILNELDNNYINLHIADMKFQTELNWKAATGLEFHGLAAIRYQSSSQEHFVKDNSNQAQAYRAGIYPEDATIRESNPYLYTNPDDANALPETILPKGGIYFRNDFSMSQVDFRGTVSYNHAFGISESHILSLFGGAETNMTDRNQVNFEGWGFLYDNGGIPFVDYNLFKQKKEENSVYYGNSSTYSRSIASFASGTYSYKGKYILNLTGRYEGTNKLGKSRQARWLPTWNIASAWNVHEEDFFSKLKPALSHLTFKVSYSLTADRGPSSVTNAEPIYRSYTPWRALSGVSETGLTLEDIENSELTYEKKHEFNVGTDIGFLNNRINLSVDGYLRNNYDLIGLIYSQGVGGITAKYANVAAMKSNGAEATLSTKNIKRKNFNWTTDFTFSFAKNEITDLDSKSNVIQLVSGSGYAQKGYPVRALFSIPFEGLNDEGLPQFMNQDDVKTVTDIDFQNFSNTKFLKYEGPTDPTITGGFGNVLAYKAIKLNVFITYSFGNKVRLDPVFRAVYSDMTSLPKEFKNRWTVPGDELLTDIPTIASKRQYYNNSQLAYAYNAYNYSTARIADGGFVRLKEVSLSYDIPSKLLIPYKINNLQLKLQATNLFLLYADKKLNGQDPEFMNSGGVASPMPQQFTLTLRLGI